MGIFIASFIIPVVMTDLPLIKLQNSESWTTRIDILPKDDGAFGILDFFLVIIFFVYLRIYLIFLFTYTFACLFLLIQLSIICLPIQLFLYLFGINTSLSLTDIFCISICKQCGFTNRLLKTILHKTKTS